MYVKKSMMSIILSVIIDVKMYMYIDCVCLCVCVCVWIGDYRSPTGDDYMCMYSYTCRYKIKKNVQKLSIQYLHCLFQTKCCLTQFVKYLRHQKKNDVCFQDICTAVLYLESCYPQNQPLFNTFFHTVTIACTFFKWTVHV